MATFVSLSRDVSGEIVHVNMDYVILMERLEKYTILRGETSHATLTVIETPAQIYDLMERSRKS